MIHFDSHMDTVRVNDPSERKTGPFGAELVDGMACDRGAADRKGGMCVSVYAAAPAKRRGLLEGERVYVTGSVCEEYCDGVCPPKVEDACKIYAQLIGLL